MRYVVIASNHILTWDEARFIADKLRLTNGKCNLIPKEQRFIRKTVRQTLEDKLPQATTISWSPTTVASVQPTLAFWYALS